MVDGVVDFIALNLDYLRGKAIIVVAQSNDIMNDGTGAPKVIFAHEFNCLNCFLN